MMCAKNTLFGQNYVSKQATMLCKCIYTSSSRLLFTCKAASFQVLLKHKTNVYINSLVLCLRAESKVVWEGAYPQAGF